MNNAEQDFVVPPFPSFPSIGRYVDLGPVSEAIARIERSVVAREAISLIIGPPGTGKSLACGILARHLAETHDVVQLGETSLGDSSALYRMLLYRLGVAIGDGRGADLEIMLHEHLMQSKRHVALIVDEAAALSGDVLENIRRVTNIMRDGQPVVSAIVVGGPRLDETLSSPSMDPFVQRVSARCYLHALSAEETGQYITTAIAACEASPEETISREAISAVHHASGGVPRLINQLMTEAIDCAAELDQSVINETTINQAWARLQQLPSPIVEEPAMKSASIEFGELTENFSVAGDGLRDEFKSEFAAESISRASAMESELEIAFEPESASVEQAAEVAPAADPATLFGSFDDEEQLDIGMENTVAASSPASDVDLESMLHCEIIGLSQYAADNTADRNAGQEESNAAVSGAAATEPSDDGIASAEDLASDADVPSVSAPNVVWYDESDADDTDRVNDDSDLLWITEDVELERRESIVNRRVDQATDADPPRLNIDYREMLEKMRRHG
ncbi:AAA family ATPase [Roseiconus lacunae]|uniref:AAA family ATPase n=1 Tax=Roseiconus lacunae TaxID=2605694 RepID=UPI003088087E|nr:AAA family ATPase [Stieleria sp. HD01]